MGIIARQSIKASLVGLIGVAIGAFSRLFLYTKFLTTSEIGLLETIVKLGVLMSPFFIIGAPQVITRYFNRFKEKELNDRLIFTYSILLLCVLIPVSTVIYLLCKDLIFSLYSEAPELPKYYILPLIVAITFGGYAFLRCISVVHMRITVPAFISGVLDRLFIVALLIMYGVFNWINIDQFYYLNIIAFYVLPVILMIVYLIVVIKPAFVRSSIDTSKQILMQTVKYNSYLLFGSLSGVIIAAIDVNMISGKLGTSFAGIYTIAFFMGTVIEIPRRSLTNIIIPLLNQAVLKKDKLEITKLYSKSSINQFLIGSFIFLVVWTNIDNIFRIIPNGEHFESGKFVVLFIGLSKLFDMMMGVNRQIIELSKYYKINLFINITLSVLVISLNLVFIPLKSPIFGGINGVAFASLIAMVCVNVFSLVVIWRKEGIQPFSLNTLKGFIPFFIILFSYSFIDVPHNILSIFLRSVFTIIVFVLCTYYFRISEDFILILRSLIKRFK